MNGFSDGRFGTIVLLAEQGRANDLGRKFGPFTIPSHKRHRSNSSKRLFVGDWHWFAEGPD